MLPGLPTDTILPTSEDIEGRLPLPQVSATPVGRAATNLGTLAGGFYNGPGAPIRAVTAVPGALRHGAEEFVRASAIPATRVVKPKGGNWIQQSLEEGLAPLKRPLGLSSTDDLRRYLETARTEFPDLVPQYEQQLRERLPKEAINKWVEGPLTKYVKTYMGTPEDPVRAAIERRAGAAQSAYESAVRDAGEQLARAAQIKAEGPRPGMPPGIWEGAVDRAQYQGETALQAAEDALRMSQESQAHVPLKEFWSLGDPAFTPWYLRKARSSGGFPETGMATYPAAMGWERGSDLMVRKAPAGDILVNVPKYAEANPWLAKLDPNEPVYILGSSADGLANAGLPDLIDTLESAMNPRARLPEHLKLNPEDLAGYSMEKAVQRAADINAWKAEQQAAKDAAKAAKLAESPAVRVHKEYPESARGLRWVEIQKPEGADDATKILEEQLKNEGRLMDNCVGGYCSKVESGNTRIYSLRDAKGNPHVTVEVGTPSNQQTVMLGDPRLRENFTRGEIAQMESVSGDISQMPEDLATRVKSVIGADVPSIVQIKGKQNKAPSEQYLPYVQDFVKGGKWSEIGDFRNAGLFRADDYFGREQLQGIRDLGFDVPNYLTDADAKALEEAVLKKTTEGFAQGGLVNDEPMGYNPDLVDSMVEQLRTELMHGQ